jgi:hypothetical protein
MPLVFSKSEFAFYAQEEAFGSCRRVISIAHHSDGLRRASKLDASRPVRTVLSNQWAEQHRRPHLALRRPAPYLHGGFR